MNRRAFLFAGLAAGSWPRALRYVLAQVPRKSGPPRFLIVQEGRTLADLKQYLE
jgi:hypothetical protein